MGAGYPVGACAGDRQTCAASGLRPGARACPTLKALWAPQCKPTLKERNGLSK
jgi:hypothetical protein